ncbi:hypothetical protein AB1484_18550 [Parafrankia sp. FMc6]
MAGRAEWADYFGNGPECLSPDTHLPNTALRLLLGVLACALAAVYLIQAA